ncbi:flagellin [Azorhizobium oxalatiphilum]|uniref:Flagellin n=2 Tax=Azorhizobium oxalatiphilum TaxID=980631 RepID=A0A917BJ55_9HYPH|nr:flagellin [Azorhizobium oxalatiphilum]
MTSIKKLQNEITDKSTEISTGRYADLGLTLGVRTSLSIDLRKEYSQLNGQLDSNVLTQALMTRTQTGLTAVLDSASTYQTTLLSSQASATTVTQMAMEGQASLSNLIAAMNTTDGTRAVFGGINSGENAMKDFEDGAQAALEQSFEDYFGFPMTDTEQMGEISGAQMDAFLKDSATGFASLFTDANWSGTTGLWSNASDQVITKQITSTESVTASVSANNTAIRQLAMAYTMMGYLNITSLNDEALQTVMDTARASLSSGMTGVTNAASAIGVSQNRTTNATDNLEKTLDVVSSRITSLESVDPATAKTELDTLTNQLEMSYSVTTKLLSLTIMDYV